MAIKYGKSQLRYPNKPRTLAQRLARIMHAQGIGAWILSRRAKVPLYAVQRILDEKVSMEPSLWTVTRLAIALGVSVDYLAGVIDAKGETSPSALAASPGGTLTFYD